MGRLLYGSQEREIEIDDRALAHVQIVVVGKLRRSESFTFSWASPDAGRATIWIHPAIPVQFQYDSSDAFETNQAWLRDLDASAARGNFRLSAEPKA